MQTKSTLLLLGSLLFSGTLLATSPVAHADTTSKDSLATAADQLATLKQNVAKAKSALDSAKDNLAKAQAEHDKLQAQLPDEKKAKAAQEALDDSEKTLTSAQAAVDKISGELATAEKEVTDLQAQITQQQSKLNDINNQESETQTQINDESTKQYNENNSLNNILDTIRKNKPIIYQIATDQEAVKKAQQEVDYVQNKIDGINESIKGSTNVNDLENELKNLQSSVEKIRQNWSELQLEMQAAQQQIDSIKASKNSGNFDQHSDGDAKISWPQGFTDELKNNLYDVAYSGATSPTKDQYTDVLHNSDWYKNGGKNTLYQISDATPIDINNLTTAQLTNLTQFAEYLLNPIREKLGNTKLTATSGAVQFAKAITDQYKKDNWSMLKKNGHDISGVNKISDDYGLMSGQDTGEGAGQYYESVGGSWYTVNNEKITTMGQLKTQLLYSVNSMLFDDQDSNFGHLAALVGAESNQNSLSKPKK